MLSRDTDRGHTESDRYKVLRDRDERIFDLEPTDAPSSGVKSRKSTTDRHKAAEYAQRKILMRRSEQNRRRE